MSIPEKAEELGYKNLATKGVHACSQAVLLAIMETIGPSDDLLVKAAGPMAGGSRSYSLCGALQGGILSIGMHYGPTVQQGAELEPLIRSYQPVKKYYQKFEEAFGSRYCHELVGGNLEDPKVREAWLARGGWNSCAQMVGKAARMVAEIILEDLERGQKKVP